MSLHNCHIPVSVPVPGRCLNKWHCFLLYFNSFCPFFFSHLASSCFIPSHPTSSCLILAHILAASQSYLRLILVPSSPHPRLILASSSPHCLILVSFICSCKSSLIPSSPSSPHPLHPEFNTIAHLFSFACFHVDYRYPPHPSYPLIPLTLSLIQLLIHSHFAWFYLVHPVFNTIDHLYLSLIFPSSPLPWV